MAYNWLREYCKWRRWKYEDEKFMQENGMDESAIAEIRDFDRIAYNSNNRFYKRLNDVGEFYEEVFPDKRQAEITSVEQLIDDVENHKLHSILKETDERTLQIIFMKVQGYSINDISEAVHLSKSSIYHYISKLRNKFK